MSTAGRCMARNTSSGTVVGPGIARNSRPARTTIALLNSSANRSPCSHEEAPHQSASREASHARLRSGSIEIAGSVRETGGDICVEDKDGDVQILQRLRTLGATLLLAACAASSATQAQDFPNRPIRFIVAFPAGGPTDFVARILADRMNALLGQIVLVENKPGANAAFGAAYVAKSEPDGYTLFVTTAGAFTINPNLRSDMPYDPVRDFAPVTLIVSTSEILVANPDIPIRSVAD